MTGEHTLHAHAHQGDGPGAGAMGEAFWDERYGSRDALWSGNPNPQLVAEAADLVPGTALDVGCGEGADAIWLAERGWRVTAVDISAVALERGAAQAAKRGADVARRIDWRHEDLTAWVPAEASYDLVSAQFMHLPKNVRESFFRVLAAAVTAGGSLLIVGHHPSDLQIIPRPLPPEFFSPPTTSPPCSTRMNGTSSSARLVSAAPPTPTARPSPSTTRCSGLSAEYKRVGRGRGYGRRRAGRPHLCRKYAIRTRHRRARRPGATDARGRRSRADESGKERKTDDQR